MPDYTRQLEEIAHALSRPAFPVWVPVLISSILSFLSALMIFVVQQLLGEYFKRRRMQRILYIDLAELFSIVESINEFSEVEEARRWKWKIEQLKLHVFFKGERFLRENLEVYVQLPERMVADNIYTHFHRALDDVDNWSEANWSVARQMFAQAVYDGHLRPERFQRFLGKKRARWLITHCNQIHVSSQQRLAAIRSR